MNLRYVIQREIEHQEIMNTQNQTVNISIPADQVAAVQSYLMAMQISTPMQINEDDNQDNTFFCGQNYEINEVIGHTVNNSGTQWEFRVKWSDGTEGWVADGDCNCEVLISKYLHLQGINTVYIYCRVSTKSQAREECVSLDAQLADLLHLAKQTNCKRIKIIQICKGAYNKVPKEIIDICDAAQTGDQVMIYRVDRLSRNIFDFLSEIEGLRKKGVPVYSHQDDLWYTNKSDRVEFVQKILDAQKESELIGKRVQSSIDFRRLRGDHVGSVIYGKMHQRDSSGKMIVVDNPLEIEIIKKVRRMEGYPIDVANYLNSEGIKKRGRFWSSLMVSNLRIRYNVHGVRVR